MSLSNRRKSSIQFGAFLFSRNPKIPEGRKAALLDFSKRLSIKFTDLTLLDLAFHHRSVSNEQTGEKANNERLEFLGDSVLGMVVATYLYESMQDKSEGGLSKIKSVVVSEATLSQIALNCGVDYCLILGKGEELSGGREKKAILADALEAVIGAYYLDSGYSTVEKLVRRLIEPEILKIQNNKHIQDSKSLLQEYCQKKYRQCPVYCLVDKIGPEHDRTFFVSARIKDEIYGPEQGKSKKEAEQAAARRACAALGLLTPQADAE
jgi:ribonuclease-3